MQYRDLRDFIRGLEQRGELKRDGLARIEMPFGDTHLAELPDGPLVLIAAGTGMGPVSYTHLTLPTKA